VLTTCQPSTVWCSWERLPAAAAQPAQGSSEPVAPRIYLYLFCNPEDNSEHHTRRRENLKSHIVFLIWMQCSTLISSTITWFFSQPCILQQYDLNLLAVLLYIFSIRVGKTHAHEFLISVHSSSFIMHSFLLTVMDCKHIPFVLMFWYNRHNTPTQYAL
jgi:hypothetical protein